MSGESLRIKTLHLRISGMSAERVRDLGDEVAHRIAHGLNGTITPQRLGTLDLQVKVPIGTPSDRLASIIAAVVLERLT